MLTKLFTTVLVLGVAFVVVTSLPDLARYLKIREL
jgi:hypothetical protein